MGGSSKPMISFERKYEIVQCSWFNSPVVRIATIGSDYCCAIHSVLSTIDPTYQTTTLSEKRERARQVRNDLAELFFKDTYDENYDDYGHLAEAIMTRIKLDALPEDKDLPSKNITEKVFYHVMRKYLPEEYCRLPITTGLYRYFYNNIGLPQGGAVTEGKPRQNLFRTRLWHPTDLIENYLDKNDLPYTSHLILAKIFKIVIVYVDVRTSDIGIGRTIFYPESISSFEEVGADTPIIFIHHTGNHFEPVGIRHESANQVVFLSSHQFVQAFLDFKNRMETYGEQVYQTKLKNSTKNSNDTETPEGMDEIGVDFDYGVDKKSTDDTQNSAAKDITRTPENESKLYHTRRGSSLDEQKSVSLNKKIFPRSPSPIRGLALESSPLKFNPVKPISPPTTFITDKQLPPLKSTPPMW